MNYNNNGFCLIVSGALKRRLISMGSLIIKTDNKASIFHDYDPRAAQEDGNQFVSI